jgi:hypothetical protein
MANSVRWVLAVRLLILFAVGSAAGTVGQQVGEKSKKTETMQTPLVFVLERLGEKYDRYFTIEQASKDRQSTNWLEALSVAVPVPKKHETSSEQQTLEQALQSLNISAVSFERDAKDARIIHVIDKRLMNLPAYALNKQVNALSFEGTVLAFLEKLESLGFPVTVQRVFAVGGPPPFLNVSSPVRLHEFTGTLRQALTVAIPQRGYHRVVWTATTRLGGPKLETLIAYQGPTQQEKEKGK